MITIFTSFFFAHAEASYSTQLYYSISDAKAACSGRVCAASGLASNMPGYYCDQYRAINPATHQQAVCQGGSGTWTKTVAAPSNCDFVNKWSCWNTANNCWNTLSSQCTNWCTCWSGNQHGAAPLPKKARFVDPKIEERLGASSGDASSVASSGDASSVGSSHHRNNEYCPYWLPQAQGQLSPGAVGFSCWNPGAFCEYPSYRMNFVCSNLGVWKLQGPAPTPKPNECPKEIWNGKRCYSHNKFCAYFNGNYVCANGRWKLQGKPSECPSSGNIWNGKPCNSRNQFCSYFNGNYVCANGRWQLQGNPPAPTPKPTKPPTNDVTCPSADYPPKDGNYCTTTGQLCKYSCGNFKCDNNGVWKKLLL